MLWTILDKDRGTEYKQNKWNMNIKTQSRQDELQNGHAEPDPWVLDLFL